ncbi:MAG: redox-sensing transcriptional repressor Rex [bacterium]
MLEEKKISEIVIPRILQYLRIVQQIEQEKINISSEELAEITNINAFQIRKDLANFGKFGQPGKGYNVLNLKKYLLDIINAKKMCNLAIVGVGNLGSALLNYKGFEQEGLKFVAAFDQDKNKIGKLCGNIIVEDISNIKESVKKNNIHIGIIAVSYDNAQMIADKLIESGVFSILNFAPVVLNVPKEITLRNVDLTIEIKALRYFSVVK